jgi:polyphosphate kinase 2 (PPK2 family)
MGFCTDEQYERFLRVAPSFEREAVDPGIQLIEYFFDVSQDVQEERFPPRASDPLKHWKLSPMDVESWRRWWDCTTACARMLEVTDTEHGPWRRVHADDERRARLNCISHILSLFPYKKMKVEPPEPGRRRKTKPGAPETLEFKHEVPQVD